MFSLFLENSQVLSLQMSLPHSLSSLLLQLKKMYIRLLTESHVSYFPSIFFFPNTLG